MEDLSMKVNIQNNYQKKVLPPHLMSTSLEKWDNIRGIADFKMKTIPNQPKTTVKTAKMMTATAKMLTATARMPTAKMTAKMTVKMMTAKTVSRTPMEVWLSFREIKFYSLALRLNNPSLRINFSHQLPLWEHLFPKKIINSPLNNQ